MLRRIAAVFLILLTLAFLVSAGTYFWYTRELQPVSLVSPAPEISFIIAPDESAGVILNDLYQKSLIKSVLVTKAYLKLTQNENRLRPGAYVLTADKSTPEIIKILMSGPTDIKVTLPEGWRREQIAFRLDSSLNGPLKNFSAADFIKKTAPLEGFLFPDTYLLPPEISTDQVISLFVSNFKSKTGLDPDLPETRNAVILASLVERETNTASDRLTVASIMKKRLGAGWPLQIDATVQYAQDSFLCRQDLAGCQWWKHSIDPKFASVYNTYLNSGLPPAPICNPGLAVVEAVKNASDTPYWYYMTGDDGVTYFAKTLPEHNLNIDKHLSH